MLDLEIAYGNIEPDQAERLGQAAGAVDDVAHIPGSAEPWVSRLVHSFIIATGAQTVLETGCYQGGTAVWIIDALQRLGGGRLHLCEIDPERMKATSLRVTEPATIAGSGVSIDFHQGDVLDYLRTTKDRFDLAWVDDNHEKKHVEKELMLLYPLMNPGGIILGHDVWGTCDLQDVFKKFSGFSVNLPRLGAAGGVGIIQVAHPDSLIPTTNFR